MAEVKVQAHEMRGLFGLAAGGWLGLSGLFASLAATSPEAALAHAGWCLAGGAAPLSFDGVLILGHCPWCYAALGAGLIAASLGLAARQRA
jgi:hypothetical protein